LLLKSALGRWQAVRLAVRARRSLLRVGWKMGRCVAHTSLLNIRDDCCNACGVIAAYMPELTSCSQMQYSAQCMHMHECLLSVECGTGLTLYHCMRTCEHHHSTHAHALHASCGTGFTLCHSLHKRTSSLTALKYVTQRACILKPATTHGQCHSGGAVRSTTASRREQHVHRSREPIKWRHLRLDPRRLLASGRPGAGANHVADRGTDRLGCHVGWQHERIETSCAQHVRHIVSCSTCAWCQHCLSHELRQKRQNACAAHP
jgi:hypothetical protein